jgi:diguanylate cyclase (GGDEF)-like protein/putative nucleotidyltransferase with HDIG domain
MVGENLDERAAEAPAVPAVAASFETRVMSRALAGLFAAGATLSLLTLVLPHAKDTNELGLILVCADAFIVAAIFFWGADSIPRWALPVALAWGTAHVAGVAYFSSESPSPLVFFYLWIYLYSAYFFTKVETVLQISWVGVVYLALLVALPPSDGIAPWWIVGMGTLLVAALMIVSMRGRVERLIAQLFDTARIDPLTKLLNRRGFRESLDLELERARRSDLPMAIVVGDLDFFKEVNDRLGHPAGDTALRRVGGAVEEAKRRIDAAARVGGEEFAMILPDTDAEGALALAERMRLTIEGEFAGDPVPVTISFGIAGYPEHGETAGAIIRAADEALYAAKEEGRNRTVIHDPDAVQAMHGRATSISGERYLAILLNLSEAVDLRLSGSARHSETVGRYAEMMALELGLPETQVRRVKLAGILHDIGKVNVPQSILCKPGSLNDEEWEIVKQHPEQGAQILEHPDLDDVRGWVGSHHERPDGTGYPSGLAGRELALEARILAVADAFEAMTSDRSYRLSIGLEAAREELRRCAGSQFDPRVVDALLSVLDREPGRARALAAVA